MENSERVTDSTIKDLYADGAYQSPDNREFAKNHNAMQLKTGKMQGGCRWELISHDEDGLNIRRLLLATPMRPSKPSQSRVPESDGESHATTKPVGVTLKTKTLKPIS